MEFPNHIKSELIKFIDSLPIKKYSKDWTTAQCAITMLNAPQIFKKGKHVFIKSNYRASEDGCYDNKEMSIKIYPHKITMTRRHSEYNSPCDIDYNHTYRYIFPNEKYNEEDFDEVMDDLSDLFCEPYLDDCSKEVFYTCYTGSNFSLETNI